jgi:type IV secretory pathway VirB10-like protein
MLGESSSQGRTTVVYIEADHSNALLMQYLLGSRSNFTLYHAHDGASGLELCKRVEPDLVITEMHLPDVAAYEVLCVLRDDRATKNTPCIVLSGDAMPAHIEQALASGFDGYWTKPIDIWQLMQNIEDVATAAISRRCRGRSTEAALSSTLTGFDPLAAGPASTAAQPADPTATQNRQAQKEAFLRGSSTETRNSGNLQMPALPYQVVAGTVIAVALVTGLKSVLPGDVIATVTEPVYDTATGRFLLIPQGSFIFGRYNSQVSYGQSCVKTLWNRIILPDTSSLTLDNLVGTDPAGYAGVEDEIDRH